MALDFLQNIELSDKEYNELAALIYEKAGINLGDQKKELIKARLMKRLRFHGFKSFQQYYNYVVEDKEGIELVEMIDAISTNVTSFFREDQHFKFLTSVALPEILKGKQVSHERRVRGWSSACSTGEEPYTIMLTLLSFLNKLDDWDFKLLATDISTKVLNIAQNGVYSQQRVAGVNPGMLEKYFDKRKDGTEQHYAIQPWVKEHVIFRRLNLIQKTYPFQGKFDFIFCRNVMIYFDRQTQESLVQRLCRYLSVGGYLFIGHSESLAGYSLPGLESVAPATYKKTA